MILFVYSLVSIYWTHSVSAARGFGSKYLQINKKKNKMPQPRTYILFNSLLAAIRFSRRTPATFYAVWLLLAVFNLTACASVSLHPILKTPRVMW